MTDSQEIHVLQGDFAQAVGSPTGGYVEAEVVIDGTTKEVRIWVPSSGGSVPSATTTTEGIVELAENNESAASKVVQSNDDRMSNARTPSAHGHDGNDIDDESLPVEKVDSNSTWIDALTSVGSADAGQVLTKVGSNAQFDDIRRTVQSEHGDPVRTICSNTTTEETALSYTIPADTLATHDVYYEIEFDVLQNHGSTVANRMRINLGATEAHSSSSSWTQNDVDRFQVSMWGTISSRGATNKQRVSWQAMAGTPISAGGQWINGDQEGNGANDTAEDSTGDLTFEVTFQWAATQSNGDFRIFRTRIELVPH